MVDFRASFTIYKHSTLDVKYGISLMCDTLRV